MDLLNQISASFPHSLEEFGYKCDTVSLYPIFMCVHFYLVIVSLRSQPGAVDYSHRHPFASWFVCVTSCFGGTLIQNALLGKPLAEIYLNRTNLITASVVWYLVFFAPRDILINICEDRIVKSVLLLLKEVQRMRGIKAGVLAATSAYPQSWFVAVLLGAVRGSGAKLVGRPLFHFIRGETKAENEFLRPTFSTKNSVVTATLLLLHMKGVIGGIDFHVLLAVLVLVAGIVQVLLLLTDMKDPYSKLEGLVCKVLLDMPKEVTSDNKKKVE